MLDLSFETRTSKLCMQIFFQDIVPRGREEFVISIFFFPFLFVKIYISIYCFKIVARKFEGETFIPFEFHSGKIAPEKSSVL